MTTCLAFDRLSGVWIFDHCQPSRFVFSFVVLALIVAAMWIRVAVALMRDRQLENLSNRLEPRFALVNDVR